MKYLYGSRLSSDAAVKDFESSVGHSLPSELKALVLEHDGCVLEPCGVQIWNPIAERKEYIECNSLLPFEIQSEGELTIQDANLGDHGRPPWLVLFGLEAGGYLFGLDCRDSASPKVVLLHLGTVIDNFSQIIPVSESFRAFMDSLLAED